MFLAASCFAQTARTQDTEKEPAAILEVGAAGEWATKGGGAPSFGPSLAAEITPIDHWLEIEGGVTPLFSRGRTEWDSDLLFKKPFTLSQGTEFMIGAVPSWSHTVAHGRSDDAMGVEAGLDFMFWPWKGRTFGWYIEPSFGYSFASGHEQALGVSVGLLIPIP